VSELHEKAGEKPAFFSRPKVMERAKINRKILDKNLSLG
jgi:hypothetical protein